MGMRERDSRDPTQVLDGGYGLVIQQTHTFPEHIALLRLHQQCALCDGKGRFCANACETWFEWS